MSKPDFNQYVAKISRTGAATIAFRKLYCMGFIVLAFGACAPEPIIDADQPYTGKWSPRPEPRPTPDPFIPNPDCPHKHISEDCDQDRPPVEPPEKPPVECTSWKIGHRYALGKECAEAVV